MDKVALGVPCQVCATSRPDGPNTRRKQAGWLLLLREGLLLLLLRSRVATDALRPDLLYLLVQARHERRDLLCNRVTEIRAPRGLLRH